MSAVPERLSAALAGSYRIERHLDHHVPVVPGWVKAVKRAVDEASHQ